MTLSMEGLVQPSRMEGGKKGQEPYLSVQERERGDGQDVCDSRALTDFTVG